MPMRPQRPVASPPSANNLVAPMQNMHLQQQQQQQPLPQRPLQQQPQHAKRVYPVNPEVASMTNPAVASQPSNKPWPHGLPPPTQPAQSPSSAAGVGYTQGPYTNTGQHLPPDLRPPQQPRPRIDPDQMPAPVQVREQDQMVFGDKFFGNCNPRYIRSTMDKIPFSKELADQSKLPLGLVVQPLAKPKKEEVPIQTIDHGEEGPVRCSRCRAYVNPWCTFIQGGSKFVCSICSHANQVPTWYFANVDMSGRRTDVDQRPELRYGTVEFQVPSDYHSSRKPAPLNYVFAIDVSGQAIRNGMTQAVCDALKQALYGPRGEGDSRLQSENRVGLITFDRSVQFYNLAPALSQAQMLVVPDINDMFLPLQEGFLVDPVESRDVIVDLLNSIPTMFKDSVRPEAVYTSAVRGGLLALQNTGGQLFVFQSCLPNYGSDALRMRDDKGLYNTDKEKQLLNPQSEAYKDLGNECVKNAMCVNTWLFPSEYIDVATIGAISSLTGGDLRYYPGFNGPRDSSKIIFQLDHDVHRETGFDGVMRIRCSDGLQVIDHYGNCHMSTYTDMDLAGIDQDKAFAAVLKHDSKLDIAKGANFQVALLYTTRSGERRVRVHNLNLSVTNQIADVFRAGDEDTAISIMLRKAIFDAHHRNRRDIHSKLTEECVNILTAYRTNCAASTSAGQLILPEAFKLLPVYVHGAVRSHALRGVGVDMNIDIRAASMKLLNSLSVYELVTSLYPRLFAVDRLTGEDGVANLKGEVKLPPMTRVSYERLNTKGAYLLDTGSDLYFWLGSKVPSEFLEQVFNVSRLDQVDINMSTLPILDNSLSERINDIARQLQSERARCLQLRIVRQDMDALEFAFSTWMTEDRNAEVQTYVDFMCVLHRKIQDEMKKNSNY
ncbi:Sec23/Sec24 trunk domain-containing protein [Fennellomyces sp. T-0311]|nr:Sec23/Sec24 trunk domain-containing protein [Fennellomyces sp. T-0311]